jgi:hypothetical protein
MTVQLETIKDYIEANIKVSLKKKTRARDMCYARAVYYKLAKRYTVQSLSSIGKLVGRDHATVLHGLKLFDEAVMYSEPLKIVYDSFSINVENKNLEEADSNMLDIKNLAEQNKRLKRKVFKQNLEIDILKKQKIQPTNKTEEFIDLINSVDEDKLDMLYTRLDAIVKMI